MSTYPNFSNRCNKLEIKPNIREIEWTSLMNECLIKTEIYKKSGVKCDDHLDPNSVMDLRHKMVKESSKVGCSPQGKIYSEALELLRASTCSKMLKQKEGRMVEKEISRLKQTLDNNRFLTQKQLEQTTNKKTKHPPKSQKLGKCYGKQYKRLEVDDGFCEVDSWNSNLFQMTMKTKINHQGIPCDVKVSLKRQDLNKELLKQPPNIDRSITNNEIECVNQYSGVDKDRSEIMRRFFEHNDDPTPTNSPNSDCQSDSIDDLKDNIKVQETQNKMNLRRMQHALSIWRSYTREHKNRKREKTIYKSKIDAFLSKLEENGRKEEENIPNNKHGVKSRLKLKKNLKTYEERRKHLEKVMEEVKKSRTEACQKLQEITRINLKNVDKSPEPSFLKRMEERREERLKRWREIQEKKLKLEEEKKTAKKLEEDEKKQKEEENRKKKLEEERTKRKLEEEKRKEREREREKLKLGLRLAEDHYPRYLMLSYGLRPWMTLMKIRNQEEQQAAAFYEKKLKQSAFCRLAANAREQRELKEKCADEFCEKILKKNFLLMWWSFYQETIRRKQVAEDWNELRITERAFAKWLEFTHNEHLEYLDKKQIALDYYERRLKMKCLKKLRDYPELKKLEEAKENRKRKWREKVREILPDFQPALICVTENRTQFSY